MSKPQSPTPLPLIVARATKAERAVWLHWAAGEMARRRLKKSGGTNGGMRPKDHRRGDPACDCSTCARKSNKTR